MYRVFMLAVLLMAPICCCFGRLSVGMQGSELDLAQDYILLQRLPTLTVTPTPPPAEPDVAVAADSGKPTPVPAIASPTAGATTATLAPGLPPTFTPQPNLPTPFLPVATPTQPLPTLTQTPLFTPTVPPPSPPDSSGGSDSDSSNSPTVAATPTPTGTPSPTPIPLPGVSFGAADYGITENDVSGQVVVNIALSSTSPQTVNVNVATTDNTATAGLDYVAVSSNVAIIPGASSISLTVTIINDTFAEGFETFNLILSSPVSATLGLSNTLVTITSDEQLDQLTNTSGCNPAALNPSLSTDGIQIAFTSNCDPLGSNPDGNYEVFLYNISSSNLSQVTDTGGCSTGPTNLQFSADGSRLVFGFDCDPLGSNADGNAEIFLYNSAAGTLTQLTTTTTCASARPSLNSNGTQVTFNSTCDLVGNNLDGSQELYLNNISTSTLSQLTVTTGCSVNAQTVSANGAQIAFTSNCDPLGSNADGNVELFLYDIAAASVSQLTNTSGCGVNPPAISGNGARIAFTSNCNPLGSNGDGSSEAFLFVGGLTQLTSASGCGVPTAVISGDGALVAFDTDCDLLGSNPDGSNEVYLYTVAAATATQITTTQGCAGTVLPAIDGDGSRVGFGSSCDFLGNNSDGNLELYLGDF